MVNDQVRVFGNFVKLIQSFSVSRIDDLFSVDVANTGDVAGKEIVELYVSRVFGEKEYNSKPVRQLKAWAKVELQPNEKKTVTMEVPLSDVTFWSNRLKKMLVEEGNYKIEVGPNSADLPCSVSFSVSGTWMPKLENVYAFLTKYVYEVGGQGQIKTSATLENTPHLDMQEAKPVYTSSDKTVATVDDSGEITTVGQGVASVTASVTYAGETKSRTLPGVVK